jgi:hypothetical protein
MTEESSEVPINLGISSELPGIEDMLLCIENKESTST